MTDEHPVAETAQATGQDAAGPGQVAEPDLGYGSAARLEYLQERAALIAAGRGQQAMLDVALSVLSAVAVACTPTYPAGASFAVPLLAVLLSLGESARQHRRQVETLDARYLGNDCAEASPAGVRACNLVAVVSFALAVAGWVTEALLGWKA